LPSSSVAWIADRLSVIDWLVAPGLSSNGTSVAAWSISLLSGNVGGVIHAGTYVPPSTTMPSKDELRDSKSSSNAASGLLLDCFRGLLRQVETPSVVAPLKASSHCSVDGSSAAASACTAAASSILESVATWAATFDHHGSTDGPSMVPLASPSARIAPTLPRASTCSTVIQIRLQFLVVACATTVKKRLRCQCES
jgi:hypothetical protein